MTSTSTSIRTGATSVRPQRLATPDVGPAHVESFVGHATGEPITVLCHCPIGISHTHGEWLAEYGDDRAAATGASAPQR
ncbi:MAG TPA: hypothetical protein VGN33_10860 [Leifsonia sp.]|jgi:hypothetical protein|nr:hypothetical protein [Leifsonia sp.]